MKIFELHFNPGLKPHLLVKGEVPDLIFDSFCYEPENVYEKRLGSLFLVGELRNALPQNLKFLDNLASFLKRQHYSAPIKFSQEVSFKEGLKKINDFLEGIAKSGDVSWLGNLNLAVLSLTPRQKAWWGINFSKVGNVKILLLRQGQIIDVGRNLEFSEIEPYPLKIFGNIVSGKLTENDVLLVLTKEVFDFFSNKNLLEELARIIPFEEKRLKEVLKNNEKDLLKISGICLLCLLTKEVGFGEKRPRTFTFQKEAEKFSIQQVFLPFVNKFKKLGLIFKRKLARLKEIPKKFPRFRRPGLKLKIKIPKIKVSLRKPEIKFTAHLKRNLLLVSFLIFFLLLGFFIFKREEEAKLKKYQLTLTTIQEDLLQAENFLLLKNEEKAFTILKESWQKILPLAEKKSAAQKEAISLKNSLEEKLEKISKLEKTPGPELFFEFDPKEFIPQKMVFFEGNLYFYNPFADNVYKLTQRAEKSVLKTDQKFNKAASMDNSLLLFQKPNLIFLLKNGYFEGPISLKLPEPDFSPKTLATFRSNLYFLDGKNGEVVKYPAPMEQGKDSPQLWLNPAAKKALDAKSMAIDGSVWILNDDNTISRYFGGNLREILSLDFFPFPKDFSKISVQFELLYLLEPVENRLIILNKTGRVLKQFQSEKFDNLLDFAISENGKTIWLLNGVKVYQINF